MISNMTYDMMISSMIFIMFSSRKVAFDKCLTVEHYPSLHVLFKIQSGICTKKSMAPSKAQNPVHPVHWTNRAVLLSTVHEYFWRGGDDPRSIMVIRSASLQYIWLLDWKLGDLFLTIIILIINHTGPTTIYNLDRYCYEYRSYVYRSW